MKCHIQTWPQMLFFPPPPYKHLHTRRITGRVILHSDTARLMEHRVADTIQLKGPLAGKILLNAIKGIQHRAGKIF